MVLYVTFVINIIDSSLVSIIGYYFYKQLI